MVTCDECGDVMGDTKTCTHKYIRFGDKFYERNTTYFDVNKKCHDCGIINKKGNIHHRGCDMERCPRCDGQLIGCGCGNVFCDDSCGDWYSNGCDKEHAGGAWHTIPNGYTLEKPTKETIKKNMSFRAKQMNLWMVQGESDRVRDILIKKLDDKFGGINDVFKLIIDMAYDNGKKWQEAEDTIKLIRVRNRING